MPARGKHIAFPRLPIAFLLLLFLSSCATYYQKNLKFQQAYEAGNLEKANKLLEKNEDEAEGKNRLLYFMQKGVVLQMLGRYEESNKVFEQAYIFLENYKTNYSYEALSLVSNPSVIPYTGEDHEKVLIHYYKALNYLQMNKPAEALVEAKRINIKLNALNDRYENRKNRYKDDAFAHLLMGIAYEMDGDVNDAFIAYRNAYEAYKSIYSTEFGVNAPEQLKQDLLRTAYLNGFRQELEQYEREFGVDYQYQPKKGGELIFFWHNGLGPVKDEWSINFTVVKGKAGLVTFVNEEYGLNFSFPVSAKDKDDKDGLGDLKLVRVAFPKYQSRQPVFNTAQLRIDSGRVVPVETVENIDRIATSVLQDRMLRELGSSLLRLATKQAAEAAMRQKNQDLGAVISVINAVTEKADTRNWQTLPYSIGYARVQMPAGTHQIELITKSEQGQETENFQFTIEEGKTQFHIFHNLESSLPIP